MYYIYCYTNKINNHKYVGQTNNYKRRIREHRSCAFNEKASSYNDLIHKKIRQYGEENFEITILEKLYTEDIDEVNKREQYWVKKLDTYCDNGKGYNQDLGGGRRAYSSVLTQEELKEVKNSIKQGIPYIDIESKYNISASFISSINQGVYFYDEKEVYPLFRYYKEDKDYDELIDLLLNSEYSLKKISEMLNLGYSTVKKINAGTLRKGLYPTYPIRSKSANEMRADKIKILLTTTNKSNMEIAKLVNSSEETVRRIKIGESFKDEMLSYPLTNL
jgi:group I intron endonuclease